MLSPELVLHGFTVLLFTQEIRQSDQVFGHSITSFVICMHSSLCLVYCFVAIYLIHVTYFYFHSEVFVLLCWTLLSDPTLDS